MSTQLDFIMQLYMMNLLQQQQQQQYQQQQQQISQQQELQQQNILSPIKQKNDFTNKTTIIAPAESTATTTTTNTNKTTCTLTTTDDDQDEDMIETSDEQQQSQQQQQDMRKTTKRSDFTQNTNCSSSRSSCSPNSNSSFNMAPMLSPQKYLNTINTNDTLQQLLLNKLSPQATQLSTTNLTNPFIPSSNILLTPTTPNSAFKQLTDLINLTGGSSGDSLNGNNNMPQNFPLLSHPFYNTQISAETFLQSSTVTSTPTEKCSLSVDKAGDAFVQESCRAVGTANTTEESDEEEEEDNKPLSCLYNSSGTASTSTGSGETTTSSKLLISGLQNLESTTDSVESLNEVNILFSIKSTIS